MSFDCDQWRADYDETSFDDQKAAYDVIRQGSPEQICYDLSAALYAFPEGVSTVTEIGGWRGELATAVMARVPWIERWHNFEVCAWAVGEGNRCEDARYEGIELSDWPWNTNLPEADVFVASHTIEHMRVVQFVDLAENQFQKFPRLHLQIPLPIFTAPNWDGYDGTHIFEWPWEVLNGYLLGLGFELVDADPSLTCRTYQR